jgi:hypothetical protein
MNLCRYDAQPLGHDGFGSELVAVESSHESFQQGPAFQVNLLGEDVQSLLFP